MGSASKCSCDRTEQTRRWALTIVPALVIFIFLTVWGMTPWASVWLTLVLMGGLVLLAQGRAAWIRPALKGALDAAHQSTHDGVRVIDAPSNPSAVVTDLQTISDRGRRQ